MGSLLKKLFFWNFERGTGPYDVIVLAIVAFVFLTPRGWFHDQAESTATSPAAAIPCEEMNASMPKTLRCRVDAALLTPMQPSPELQEKAHNVLLRNAPPLKDRTFKIAEIKPVLGKDGGVLYYEVSVQQ